MRLIVGPRCSVEHKPKAITAPDSSWMHFFHAHVHACAHRALANKCRCHVWWLPSRCGEGFSHVSRAFPELTRAWKLQMLNKNPLCVFPPKKTNQNLAVAQFGKRAGRGWNSVWRERLGAPRLSLSAFVSGRPSATLQKLSQSSRSWLMYHTRALAGGPAPETKRQSHFKKSRFVTMVKAGCSPRFPIPSKEKFWNDSLFFLWKFESWLWWKPMITTQPCAPLCSPCCCQLNWIS